MLERGVFVQVYGVVVKAVLWADVELCWFQFVERLEYVVKWLVCLSMLLFEVVEDVIVDLGMSENEVWTQTDDVLLICEIGISKFLLYEDRKVVVIFNY